MKLREAIDGVVGRLGMPNRTDADTVRQVILSLIIEDQKPSSWYGFESRFHLHVDKCTRSGAWVPWTLPEPATDYAEDFSKWVTVCPTVSCVFCIAEGRLDWSPKASKYLRRRFMLEARDYVIATMTIETHPYPLGYRGPERGPNI